MFMSFLVADWSAEGAPVYWQVIGFGLSLVALPDWIDFEAELGSEHGAVGDECFTDEFRVDEVKVEGDSCLKTCLAY